jgi:hypothetical protein
MKLAGRHEPSPATTNNSEAAPLLVIGGLGTGRECTLAYKPLLNDGTDCALQPDKRFIWMPYRGRKDHGEVLKRLEEQALIKQQKIGRKVVLGGHSMGGYLGGEIVMNNPDIFEDFVSIAGVHEGKKHETPSTLVIRYISGNPDHAQGFNHDSPHMQSHIERVAEEWPEEVGMKAVFTPFDDLLPLGSGMELRLPDHQKVERVVITPKIGIDGLIRRLSGNRKIDIIHHPRPALHYDIVWHPALIKYMRGVQNNGYCAKADTVHDAAALSNEIPEIAA